MEIVLSVEQGVIKQTELGKSRGFIEVHFDNDFIGEVVLILNKKDAENILKLLNEKAR